MPSVPKNLEKARFMPGFFFQPVFPYSLQE